MTRIGFQALFRYLPGRLRHPPFDCTRDRITRRCVLRFLSVSLLTPPSLFCETTSRSRTRWVTDRAFNTKPVQRSTEGDSVSLLRGGAYFKANALPVVSLAEAVLLISF